MGAFFVLFCLACLALAGIGATLVFREDFRAWLTRVQQDARSRMWTFRWLLAIAVGLLPVLIFQISSLGIVFQGGFIRAMVWGVVVLIATWLVSPPDQFIAFRSLLIVITLTGGLYGVTGSFQRVTDYPFSLTWSEGNRFWDYSLLFGRDRYIYPAEQTIYVLLDPGRQLIGGLPFLFDHLSIQTLRAWLGCMDFLPYVVLGAAIFAPDRREMFKFLALAAWVTLFLAQGPIHAPLVFSAALVAAAWRRPLSVAVPLMMAAGVLAGISRYTWMFAPAMWIGMLELSSLSDLRDHRGWGRLAALILPALIAGVLVPEIVDLARHGAWSLQDFAARADLAPATIQTRVTQQPLLWYRLFPNATYGAGILYGLLLAAGPLIALLMYLQFARVWQPAWFQKIVYGAVLLAFLGVGLVVSVKIGGGGDLHNLDMFLIGLLFVASIAWRQGGGDWLIQRAHLAWGSRLMLVILVVVPAFSALMQLRSYGYYHLAPWLATLTDESPQKLGLIPPKSVSDEALDTLLASVRSAQSKGDILFMDQRQLLTFGYIQGVPLVPEYDKKVLIERAFTQNRAYFDRFYNDLANRRFSLIVAQPQTTDIKDGEYHFAEENNYWVTWVSRPLLCYYAVERTLPEVNVQLLTPRAEPVDCEGILP
ncbi:MAG: hypothetical protein WHV44_05515 [Anaerolineales bacterium]